MFTDMTRFDEERLYQLIERHLHYTGSARARAILDDWASYLPKFVKVMPVEYRRALEEMARRQSVDKPGLGEIEIGSARQRQIILNAKEPKMPGERRQAATLPREMGGA